MTTKRNLLLVSLLLVFGLAASAPFARGASTPLYGVVSYNEYTVRYNSNADALGSVTVTFTNGGQIGGGNQRVDLGTSALGRLPSADRITQFRLRPLAALSATSVLGSRLAPAPASPPS